MRQINFVVREGAGEAAWKGHHRAQSSMEQHPRSDCPRGRDTVLRVLAWFPGHFRGRWNPLPKRLHSSAPPRPADPFPLLPGGHSLLEATATAPTCSWGQQSSSPEPLRSRICVQLMTSIPVSHPPPLGSPSPSGTQWHWQPHQGLFASRDGTGFILVPNMSPLNV